MKRIISAVFVAIAAASSVLVIEAQTHTCNATTRTAIQQALVALGIALDACPDTSVEAPHVDRVVASVTQGQTPLSVTFTAELSGGLASSLEWILDTIGDGQPGVVISASSTQPLPLIFPYTFGTPGTFRMYARAANDTGTDMSDEDGDTPTITVTPGGGGDVQLHDCHWPVTDWHADVVTDPVTGQECFPGHEHGDDLPQVFKDKGITLKFGDIEATPNENVSKHPPYKGFYAVDDRWCDRDKNVPADCQDNLDPTQHPKDTNPNDNQHVYYRAHAATNPHDRMARYHSYRLLVLDAAGHVSDVRGWYDTGDPTSPGPHRPQADEKTDIRPLIGLPTKRAVDAGFGCEQWYMESRDIGPDSGWNVCGATYYATLGEHLTGADHSTWQEIPGNNKGLQRTFDLTFQRGRGDPPFDQVFYTTQWMERVSGPLDPLCGTTREIGGKPYTVLCIPQYIASTVVSIGFGSGNTWQRQYSVRNVRNPN